MIRSMMLSDIPDVIKFVRETIENDVFYDPRVKPHLVRIATDSVFRMAVKHWYMIVYHDSMAGKAVGMAGAIGNTISYLFVDTLFQGEGIGQQLYDDLEKHILATYKGNGAPVINVHSTQTAEAFYRRQGFVVKERISMPIGGSLTFMRVRMEKQFSDEDALDG